MERINQTSQEKIEVSKFAYEEISKEIKKLEREIPKKVSETNRDNPESQDAVLDQNRLNKLRSVFPFLVVKERDQEVDVIQLGDMVVLKFFSEKVGEIELKRVVDGFDYSTKVCKSLTSLIGKKIGDKVDIGNIKNAKIVNFYLEN